MWSIYSHITVLNGKGEEVIKTEKVWNTGREVREFLFGLDDGISEMVDAGYSTKINNWKYLGDNPYA